MKMTVFNGTTAMCREITDDDNESSKFPSLRHVKLDYVSLQWELNNSTFQLIAVHVKFLLSTSTLAWNVEEKKDDMVCFFFLIFLPLLYNCIFSSKINTTYFMKKILQERWGIFDIHLSSIRPPGALKRLKTFSHQFSRRAKSPKMKIQSPIPSCIVYSAHCKICLE